MDCKIERRKLITSSVIEMYSGKVTNKAQTTEIEPCGTPLFSDEEKRTGICLSCRKGWSVEGNQITLRGRKQLEKN